MFLKNVGAIQRNSEAISTFTISKNFIEDEEVGKNADIMNNATLTLFEDP